jgi:hypothetical protein
MRSAQRPLTSLTTLQPTVEDVLFPWQHLIIYSTDAIGGSTKKCCRGKKNISTETKKNISTETKKYYHRNKVNISTETKKNILPWKQTKIFPRKQKNI